jgi:hypothetical protein
VYGVRSRYGPCPWIKLPWECVSRMTSLPTSPHTEVTSWKHVAAAFLAAAAPQVCHCMSGPDSKWHFLLYGASVALSHWQWHAMAVPDWQSRNPCHGQGVGFPKLKLRVSTGVTCSTPILSSTQSWLDPVIELLTLGSCSVAY